VIRAGLPKPATACSGLSTPKAISNPAASSPITSGASQPVKKTTIERPNTSRVIIPWGCSAAARKLLMGGRHPGWMGISAVAFLASRGCHAWSGGYHKAEKSAENHFA
jgi:hypothetical protein